MTATREGDLDLESTLAVAGTRGAPIGGSPARPARRESRGRTLAVDAVAGDAVVGDAVVGDAVVGDAVVGDAVVGDAVVGRS